MLLRPLNHRTDDASFIVKNICLYFSEFNRKKNPTARITVLRKMYKYLLTVPDFIRSKQGFRETLIRKTKEFKKDALAQKSITLFNAVLQICKTA